MTIKWKSKNWPVVYIASPYTSSGRMSQNVHRSMATMHRLATFEIAAISPLLGHYLQIAYPLSDETWMQIDLALVKRADAVLRLWGDSDGADSETALAEELGIPVFYTPPGQDHNLVDLLTWAESWRKENT